MKRLGHFFALSVVAQACAALTGLLIARWSSVDDYALYTVIATVLGAISVLTRGGTSLGVSMLFGKHWPNTQRAAQIIAAGVAARKRLSWWIMPPLLGLTGWLLHCNRAESLVILALTTVVAAHWWADLQTRLIDQVPNYTGEQRKVQTIDTVIAVFRIVGTTVLNLLGLLSAVSASVLNLLAAYLRIQPLRRLVLQKVPLGETEVIESDHKVMVQMIRRQVPSDIFFCMQGQVQLVIIAWVGTVGQTAGLGALGRIAQLLLPFQAITAAYLIPSFTQVREGIPKTFLSYWAISTLPGLLLVAVAWSWPAGLLWLVGENYARLIEEVRWMALASCATSSMGAAWLLAANRGWNKYAWLQIPGFFLVMLVGAMWLNLSQLADVIILQIGFALITGLSCASDLFAAKLRKWDIKQAENRKTL